MHITTSNMADTLSRIHRQFIGSDNFFNSTVENAGFPPYNIEKLTEDSYKLSLAVAGYSKEEITVETNKGSLIIKGSKIPSECKNFIHQGIAERDFQRQFILMDNTFVIGAECKDGLLNILIKREIPELLKSKKIEIT